MTGMKGCPEGMYPLDLTYPAEYVFDTLEGFTAEAERASNILNVPLSWWFDDNEHGDGLTLIFAMPRKNLSTWAIKLRSVGDRRDEVEAWLRDFTKKEMTVWFGWEEGK